MQIHKLLRTNGYVFFFNLIIFVCLFVFKAPAVNLFVGILLAGLVTSFLLLKQQHTVRNRGQVQNYHVLHINGIVQLILFGSILLIHWQDFLWVERIYLFVYCLVQVASVKIEKRKPE